MAILASGNDNSKVVIPVGGAIGSAPEGTVVEYGATGSIPDVVSHGRVSQDGVTITPTSTTQTVYGWPYADAVASWISDSTLTFSFSLLQAQEDKNLEVYFGVEKNSVTGGYHFNPGQASEKRAWFIDIEDRTNNVRTRWYFPSANITERSEITVNGQGLLELNITLTAYSQDVEGETASAIYFTEALDAANGGTGGEEE